VPPPPSSSGSNILDVRGARVLCRRRTRQGTPSAGNRSYDVWRSGAARALPRRLDRPANSLDGRLRFRANAKIVLAAEPVGEGLVLVDRSGSIARTGQERQQPAERSLIGERKVHGAPGVAQRHRHPARRLVVLRDLPGGLRCLRPQVDPLGRHPVLPGGRLRQVLALEEPAAVEIDRLLRAGGRDGPAERRDIAPHDIRIHADLFGTAARQCPFTQLPPQVVEGLTQRRPSAGLIELGPEQRQKPFPGVERPVRRMSEVRQQRQALLLGEHGAEGTALGVGQLDGAEQTEGYGSLRPWVVHAVQAR
jgi:hypothetical protein